MEKSNVYSLRVREKEVKDGKEYSEVSYKVYMGNSGFLSYDSPDSNENNPELDNIQESTPGFFYFGRFSNNAIPDSVPKTFLATSTEPLHSREIVHNHDFFPYPLTYCLIRPLGTENKCLSIDPMNNNLAVLSPISLAPFTDEAYRQSWETAWLPSDNACNLRNRHKAFLKIGNVNTHTPPIIDVGVGTGVVLDACFWELIKISGNLPTTPNCYKIRNIRTLHYLKADLVNNQIDPTPDDTEATIWDFQISGTVPP